MKKALLAAALMSAGVVAHAQSSVTLYGRLDMGIAYMSGIGTGPSNNAPATNSSHQVLLESGYMGTSLWGMKGVEDIGGGNKVLFHLEGSFSTATGALGSAGSIWNRWATVGFENDQFGTLLLGRELFISNGVWDFDPFGQSNWSSATLVRGRNWPQSSNNVSYQSPNFAGFDVYGQYAFSNSTNFNAGREGGLQLTYTNALFQVRGIYDEIRSANGTPGGAYADTINGGNTGQGVYAFSREYSALLNVFLGQFKIQGAYQAVRSAGMTGTQVGLPTTLDTEWGGITWQATPAAALIGAVYHVNGNNGAGNATLYTIGGTYNLSKRTMLGMQVATTQNSKTANYGLNANNYGTSPATGNPLPGHSQTGVYADIWHNF